MNGRCGTIEKPNDPYRDKVLVVPKECVDSVLSTVRHDNATFDIVLAVLGAQAACVVPRCM